MKIYQGTQSNSNCITYIPQDIKLELNNGTLILKAGSKVYVPNGFENDGTTPKFDVVTTTQDYNTDTKVYSGMYFLEVNRSTGTITGVSTIQNCISGATAPSSPTSLQGWYDTTNNIIKRYSGGSEQTAFRCSFPLCYVTSDGTNITSIDQVFNGFGYIGYCTFMLPGVKYQCGNGYNIDGSYKVVSVQSTIVSINTSKASGYNGILLQINGKFETAPYTDPETIPTTPINWQYWFDKTNNIMKQYNHNIPSWNDRKSVNAGQLVRDSNANITSMTIDPIKSETIPSHKVIKETVRTYYNSHTFNPSSRIQSYTVPAGVTSIHIDCVGSQGYTAPKLGSAGGLGGRVECDLSVTPGQILYLMIGSTPSTNTPTMYNASDIRTSNADFADSENRIIVAGGGGNAGRDDQSSGVGGAGGGLTGGTGGKVYQSNGGSGGTQSAGGAGGRSTGSYPLQGHDGSKGYGGYGGYNNLTTAYYGGTGGAGWYGGGGGSMQSYNAYNNAGGGGGSSYTDSSLCSNVTHTQGYQNGDGYITISGTNVYYEDITTYKIFNV